MEEMVLKALVFSSKKHRDMYRKGNKAPYIVHPLEVMTILMTEKYPTSVLVAGLLHDTLEDTDTTKEDLLEHFGDEILHLVSYNSEDKSCSWIERKGHTIEQMNNAWDDWASALCFADKLANLRSLFRAIEANGLGIFEKMNAPKEHVMSYYYNIFLASWRLIGLEMYHEYEVLLNLVHQAVQDDRNEIDKAIIDVYGEQVSRFINKKPIDYKRLFPVVKYLPGRGLSGARDGVHGGNDAVGGQRDRSRCHLCDRLLRVGSPAWKHGCASLSWKPLCVRSLRRAGLEIRHELV